MCHSFWGLSVCGNAVRSLVERVAGSGNTSPMERNAGSRNTSLTERITGCGNIRGGDRWFHDEDFSGIWNRFFVWGTVCRLCQSKGEDTFYRHGIFQSGEAFAVQQDRKSVV